MILGGLVVLQLQQLSYKKSTFTGFPGIKNAS